MGRKFGVNERAEAARSVKEERKLSAQEAKKKAAEDAYWADDDDIDGKRKAERKAQREAKDQDAAKKKAEAKSEFDGLWAIFLEFVIANICFYCHGRRALLEAEEQSMVGKPQAKERVRSLLLWTLLYLASCIQSNMCE
jgi:hypothetical protein